MTTTMTLFWPIPTTGADGYLVVYDEVYILDKPTWTYSPMTYNYYKFLVYSYKDIPSKKREVTFLFDRKLNY